MHHAVMIRRLSAERRALVNCKCSLGRIRGRVIFPQNHEGGCASLEEAYILRCKGVALVALNPAMAAISVGVTS
jgi:hypothetical protein